MMLRLRRVGFAFLFPSLLVGQVLSGKIICIDPGHGGHNPANDRLVVPDPGVEFWESESNFQKALLLKPLLEAKGATVYLTRNTNDYPNDVGEPSLSARVAFANSVYADWFHSIHSNAFNATVNYTVLLVRESTTMLGTPESPAAQSISQIISPKIQTHLRTPNNYTRLDYTFLGYRLGVLNGLTMPGQLSEGSFHDVLPETRRLLNNSYRKMEAYAILKSFLEYFGDPQDPSGIVAGIQTDAETGKPVNRTQVRLLPEDIVFAGDSLNNGFYVFDGVTPGDHTMQFETPGYDLQIANITVATGGLHFVDRTLSSNLPPRLLSSSPQNNATGVSQNPVITLTLSRTLDRASAESNIYLLKPDSSRLTASFGWTNNDRTISLTPSATLLYDTTYRVVIGGSVLDTSGRTFDGNGDGTGGDSLVLAFRTRPFDVTPPALFSAYPADNETLSVQFPILNFTFNEPVNAATLSSTNIILAVVGGAAVQKSLQVWHGGGKTAVNIYPAQPLSPGTAYRVSLSNIEDQWGNVLQSPVTSDFVPGNGALQFETVDDFNTSPLWKQPSLDTFTVGFVYDSTNLFRNSTFIAPTIPLNSNSFRLKYGWNPDSGPWLISTSASDYAKFIQWKPEGHRLQLYMFGDGSRNEFRFALEDSVDGFPGGTIDHREVSRWIPIDWVGWRIVEWDFDKDSVGAWLGNSDLEGLVRMFGFQIRYTPGAAPYGAIYFDELQVTSPLPTPVHRISENIPGDVALSQNFPNPFNPETSIEYRIRNASEVTIDVADMLGRRVKTLAMRRHGPGHYTVTWDGRNEEGMAVASGIYLARLRAGGTTLVRKMLLLR